jgi:hypothetical protein
MIGLLTALPNTQLTRRLQKEGRLLPFAEAAAAAGDHCTAGLNFIPLRQRRDILLDYKTVLERVYEPGAYFERVRRVGRALKPPSHAMVFSFHEMRRDLAVLFRLMWRMTFQLPKLRSHFWRTLFDCARHNIGALEYVVSLMVFYLHLGPFAAFVVKDLDRQIEELDREAQRILKPAA